MAERIRPRLDVAPDLTVSRALASERSRALAYAGKRGRGGARPGSGRKPGSKNKLIIATDREIQKVIDASEDGKDLSALVLYQRVYKNPKVPSAVRMKAAALALPYESEKLQATKLTGAEGGPVEHRITHARAELESKLAGLAARRAKRVSGDPK